MWCLACRLWMDAECWFLACSPAASNYVCRWLLPAGSMAQSLPKACKAALRGSRGWAGGEVDTIHTGCSEQDTASESCAVQWHTPRSKPTPSKESQPLSGWPLWASLRLLISTDTSSEGPSWPPAPVLFPWVELCPRSFWTAAPLPHCCGWHEALGIGTDSVSLPGDSQLPCSTAHFLTLGWHFGTLASLSCWPPFHGACILPNPTLSSWSDLLDKDHGLPSFDWNPSSWLDTAKFPNLGWAGMVAPRHWGCLAVSLVPLALPPVVTEFSHLPVVSFLEAEQVLSIQYAAPSLTRGPWEIFQERIFWLLQATIKRKLIPLFVTTSVKEVKNIVSEGA